MDPIRRFTELQRQHPELTESQLLNSNNKRAFTGKADVVVAGAGILDIKIEVFEKSSSPVQKIGESTLSPFSTFTTGDILPHNYLLRLFALKDGLQFYSLDQQGREITAHDIGGLDISYQLDRRMSELFMTMWAQSIGINVYHGISVDFEMPVDCSLTKGLNEVSLDTVARLRRLGFLPTPHVQIRREGKFEGWNTDAYWTYFREKDGGSVDNRLLGWNYPATKHLCFPEGWGWFIGLISWHHAPLANLMDLVAHLITSAAAGVPADELPSTRSLSKTFACPYERITSIGWAVRDDFKLPADLSAYGAGEAEQKFNFFKSRYPTIETLLNDSYELLPGYYGGRTYFVKKGLSYRSPVAAGEGWLAIGNSAGFTNPLISPGINAGVAGAWRAANLTAKVLAAPVQEARAAMTAAAKDHQTFMHDFALPRLYNMNRLWYNSFRDHRLFEAGPRTLWSVSFKEVDDHYYGEQGANLVLGGAGCPRRRKWWRAPSEEEVQKVLAISKRIVRERTERWPENQWGRWLRQYDHKLEKVPGKTARSEGFLVEAKRCDGCKHFTHNRTNMCPVCGGKVEWEATMHALFLPGLEERAEVDYISARAQRDWDWDAETHQPEKM
ncbi:hypothetical protein B0H13DRAFT_2561412 [Mycena leptocephala]|nr:hypothetical protein B0H13DRAFT_2561412 [Mycena leptocephala]